MSKVLSELEKMNKTLKSIVEMFDYKPFGLAKALATYKKLGVGTNYLFEINSSDTFITSAKRKEFGVIQTGSAIADKIFDAGYTLADKTEYPEDKGVVRKILVHIKRRHTVPLIGRFFSKYAGKFYISDKLIRFDFLTDEFNEPLANIVEEIMSTYGCLDEEL